MGQSATIIEMTDLSNCNETTPLTSATPRPIDRISEDNILIAVLDNRRDDIEAIVREASHQLLEFRYEKYYNKTIIIIACTEDAVNEETLRQLLSSMKSKYGTVQSIDTELFGWEPIHYLAQIANPSKLEVLLSQINKVNALTYFSENALHVLLQYEYYRSTIGIEIYHDSNSKWCTIIDKEKENITKCAKLLIAKGVDINQASIWDETPICLAVGNVYPEVIKELLNITNINLDSFIGAITVGEYLKRNDMHSKTAFNVQESPVSKLFSYLKSGNDRFLQYNNGDIRDHVDSTDGEDCCGATMLQMCLTKGFFEYLKDECYHKKLHRVDIRDSPMLRIFMEKGLNRYILHLLDNDADTSKTTTKFYTPLLEYAAVRGYYPFVAILLQHKKSKIGIDEIFATLSKLVSIKLTLENHEYYKKCVLYLLLNKLIVMKDDYKHHNNIETPNKDSTIESSKFTRKKLTILNKILCELNLESNDDKTNDSELICQLLHLGASLTEKSNDSKLIVELIHPNILKLHINDCIQNNEFNYDSIIQDDNQTYSETITIHVLAKNEQKREIVVHPLFIYFLHQKWTRISWVYYLDLLFYFAFLLCIYVFMVNIGEGIVSPFINFMYNSFYALLCFHIMKEAFQLFFLYYWKYFLDTSNYFELGLIISCVFTICLPNIYSRVTAIIIATFIFFVMWGQLPRFTKYTIIFGSSKYFLEYFAFYFIQFISFAICFYILFPFGTEGTEKPLPTNNSTVTTSPNNLTVTTTSPITSTVTKTFEEILADLTKNLFHIIVYFTGEFDDRILEPKDYPFFGRVITTVFIFCMTIILNNLLVGLIVADMDEIQKRGRLYKQVKMAAFIQRSDTFIKRIHDFKSTDCIKKIIDHINIFKKNQRKVLDLTNRNTNAVFDDDDRQLLKDIKNQHAFDRNELKNVYDFITQ